MIRHAQRWLFETGSLPVSFGYGWIDPDAEMNLLDWRRLPVEAEARRAYALDGLKEALRGIVEEAKLPERGSVKALLDRYFAQSRSAKYDHLVKSLHEFVGGGSATAYTFSLSLTELPETVATVAHIEGVHLQLDPPGNLKAEVRIGRDWSAIRADGASVRGRESSRAVSIVPVSSRRELNDRVNLDLHRLQFVGGPSRSNKFWGCSPARTWTVELFGPSVEVAALKSAAIAIVFSGLPK
jgi:hypothetical protein